MEAIKEAYAILSNKERRKVYDRECEEEDAPEEDDGMQNLFNLLNGGAGGAHRVGKPKRSKMKPMQFALEVTLDEIYAGATSKMRLTRMRLCKTCKG